MSSRQWSERPPAVCPRFAWLDPFHRGPRSLSAAVAHLGFVRRMKPPAEYEPEELVALLRTAGPRLRARYFQPQPDLSDLINRSVGANTFRAFAHPARQPSEIFREWAHRYFTRQRLDDLRGIGDQTQYDRFVDCAVADLTQYWSEQGKQQLRFGGSRKLTNLLLKSLVRLAKLSDATRNTLIPLLHVPHDLFCLAAIRRSANSGRFGASISIPKNASMRFITSPAQYAVVQELVRRIAGAADEPAISVDLVAWDHAH
jgi:hypothetical protein